MTATKYGIACFKDGERIGFHCYEDGPYATRKIRINTIQLHDTRRTADDAFDLASLMIPVYDDVAIVPVMFVLTNDRIMYDWTFSLDRHLLAAKSNWPHLPKRVTDIETAVNTLKEKYGREITDTVG